MRFNETIEYDGNLHTFAYKHPLEHFKGKTELLVKETQEAIVIVNGSVAGVYGPGRHLISKTPALLLKVECAVKNSAPPACSIYFFDKTEQMSIKWGTESKVKFIEPTYNIPVEIGACGEMSLAISDSHNFLATIVGTDSGIAWDNRPFEFQKSVRAIINPLVSSIFKTHFINIIKKEAIDLFDIDEHLEKIAASLGKEITSSIAEYGLSVKKFLIKTVLLPEEDKNFKRVKELHTIELQKRMLTSDAEVRRTHAETEADVIAAYRKAELEKQITENEIAKMKAERDLIAAQAAAQATQMAGLAEATVMSAKGYTQKDVLQADVQKSFAESLGKLGSSNGAVSDMVSVGVGVEMAKNVTNQLSNMFDGINNPTADPKPNKCSSCGAIILPNNKFCPECGTKQ